MDNKEVKEKLLSIFRGVLKSEGVVFKKTYSYQNDSRKGKTSVNYFKSDSDRPVSRLYGHDQHIAFSLANQRRYKYRDINIAVTFKEGSPNLFVQTKLETKSEEVNKLTVDLRYELPFYKLLFRCKKERVFEETVIDYECKYVIRFDPFEVEVTKEVAVSLYKEVLEAVKESEVKTLEDRVKVYGN